MGLTAFLFTWRVRKRTPVSSVIGCSEHGTERNVGEQSGWFTMTFLPHCASGISKHTNRLAHECFRGGTNSTGPEQIKRKTCFQDTKQNCGWRILVIEFCN